MLIEHSLLQLFLPGESSNGSADYVYSTFSLHPFPKGTLELSAISWLPVSDINVFLLKNKKTQTTAMPINTTIIGTEK